MSGVTNATKRQSRETYNSPFSNSTCFSHYQQTAAELKDFEIDWFFLIHPVFYRQLFIVIQNIFSSKGKHESLTEKQTDLNVKTP